MTAGIRTTSSLILVEGSDEEHFIKALLRHESLPDCEVRDAKGEGGLRMGAITAVKERGPPIKRLCIVRDAEGSYSNRVKSTIGIFSAIAELGKIPRDCVPGDAYRVTRSGEIAAAFAIVPHDEEKGALESLCMRAPARPDALACSDQMFECWMRIMPLSSDLI